VAGGGGESSAFRYGAFHNAALSYEVVLASGEVATASPSVNADLFRAIPGSCGALGVITAIELRLIPAAKYVRLKYSPVGSVADLTQKFSAARQADADFIDAIMFSPSQIALMVGKLTDDRGDLRPRRAGRVCDDWFYLRVQDILARGGGEELIPLADYLFRYGRGAYWIGDIAFKAARIPNRRVSRLALSPLLNPRFMSRVLHEANFGQEYFLQDVQIPIENLAAFMRYLQRELNILPLWLIPIKASGMTYLNIQSESDLSVGVGLWLSAKLSYDDFIAKNLALERVVAELGGAKALYGHFYGDEDTFWANRRREQYELARRKYRAAAVFPDIYQKVRVAERYQSCLARGLIRAMRPRWRLPLS